MKNRTKLALLLAATLSLLVGVLACQSSPSAPPAPTEPPPSAASHHRGLATGNAQEVGYRVAETPVFSFAYPSDQGDAAFANSEQEVHIVGSGPQTIDLAYCVISPSSSVTSSNTNYANIKITKRSGDGGASTVIFASVATADAGSDASPVGNLTQWQNSGIGLTPNTYLSPGDVVTFVSDKVGTGVALPQMRISCFTTVN